MPLGVDAVRVTGRWFRHAYPGPDPLPRREPPPDARWQRGEIVDALYLADEEDTAWAEWYRHLAELGVPPGRQMPRALWTWDLDVHQADLSSESGLRRIGLTLPRPGRRNWSAYQRAGETLAADGWPGLVTRSAARPTHRVVCLFRTTPAQGGPSSVPGARPLPGPRLVTEAPAPPRGMTT